MRAYVVTITRRRGEVPEARNHTTFVADHVRQLVEDALTEPDIVGVTIALGPISKPGAPAGS